ncbi:MAG: hypothetical protein KBB70_00620 [Candidatus Pacebacteria bacterium]|nr:hypothetical protein [Candidatus Paceibacterota bacterium]
MILPDTIKVYDGDDEVLFSDSFNIYDNSIKIIGIMGLTVIFNFDEEGSEKREKDIDILGEGNNATVTFSSKIRNTLGSGTTAKVELAEIDKDSIKQKLFFSLYSSRIGDKSSGLSVNLTFYLRKI